MNNSLRNLLFLYSFGRVFERINSFSLPALVDFLLQSVIINLLCFLHVLIVFWFLIFVGWSLHLETKRQETSILWFLGMVRQAVSPFASLGIHFFCFLEPPVVSHHWLSSINRFLFHREPLFVSIDSLLLSFLLIVQRFTRVGLFSSSLFQWAVSPKVWLVVLKNSFSFGRLLDSQEGSTVDDSCCRVTDKEFI